jgi:hypothetical protein
MSSPKGSKEVHESQSPSLVAKTRDSQGLPFLPQKGVREAQGFSSSLRPLSKGETELTHHKIQTQAQLARASGGHTSGGQEARANLVKNPPQRFGSTP